MKSRDGGRRLRLSGLAVACCVLVAGRAQASPPLDPAVRACVEHLEETKPEEQRLCLGKLRDAGPAATAAIPAISHLLAGSDGATDHLVLAAALDVLRALKHRAAPTAETLSGLLPYRCKLYTGRDKLLVIRLRSYLMVTLSDIGVPTSALPALLDTLAHLDERLMPLEVGAAARAVGSLGPRGRDFAPYLLDTLTQRLSEEEFSLERYEPQFPPEEATTIQLEAVRSLGRISSATDRQVLAALQELAENRGTSELDPRVVEEAKSARKLILRRHGERR